MITTYTQKEQEFLAGLKVSGSKRSNPGSVQSAITANGTSYAAQSRTGASFFGVLLNGKTSVIEFKDKDSGATKQMQSTKVTLWVPPMSTTTATSENDSAAWVLHDPATGGDQIALVPYVDRVAIKGARSGFLTGPEIPPFFVRPGTTITVDTKGAVDEQTLLPGTLVRVNNARFVCIALRSDVEHFHANPALLEDTVAALTTKVQKKNKTDGEYHEGGIYLNKIEAVSIKRIERVSVEGLLAAILTKVPSSGRILRCEKMQPEHPLGMRNHNPTSFMCLVPNARLEDEVFAAATRRESADIASFLGVAITEDQLSPPANAVPRAGKNGKVTSPPIKMSGRVMLYRAGDADSEFGAWIADDVYADVLSGLGVGSYETMKVLGDHLEHAPPTVAMCTVTGADPLPGVYAGFRANVLIRVRIHRFLFPLRELLQTQALLVSREALRSRENNRDKTPVFEQMVLFAKRLWNGLTVSELNSGDTLVPKDSIMCLSEAFSNMNALLASLPAGDNYEFRLLPAGMSSEDYPPDACTSEEAGTKFALDKVRKPGVLFAVARKQEEDSVQISTLPWDTMNLAEDDPRLNVKQVAGFTAAASAPPRQALLTHGGGEEGRPAKLLRITAAAEPDMEALLAAEAEAHAAEEQ